MLLSLQQAILIRLERPWEEAFMVAVLSTGVVLALDAGIAERKVHKVQAKKVHIVHVLKTSQMTGMFL